MTRACIIFMLISIVFHASGCTRAEAPVISKTDKPTEPVKTPAPPDDPESAAPQSSESGYHIITRGDTLYSIAWRYDLDYLDLAAWNEIPEPYLIYPERVLRLKPPPTWSKSESPQQKQRRPSATEPAVPEKAVAIVKPPARTTSDPPIQWLWPTSGTVIKLETPTSKKGIDIAGEQGQSIKASAAGEVVYSDSGLLGYGKLIIIKHNQTYLSAYAYNSELLVKEGDKVSAGQKISKMGKTHNGRALLHFEIRKSGKPINPMNYLPKKPS